MPISPEETMEPTHEEREQYDTLCAHIDAELRKHNGSIDLPMAVSLRMFDLLVHAYMKAGWRVRPGTTSSLGGRFVVKSVNITKAVVAV